MKKLERVLVSLLVLQILAYFEGISIVRNSAGFNSFAGIPFLVVSVLLGIISIILFIIISIQQRKQQPINKLLAGFILLNLILLFSYNFIVNISF